MKTKIVLLVIIIAVISLGTAISQVIPSVKGALLSESDKAILDKHISKYTAFTMDLKELAGYIHGNQGGQFRLSVDENFDWTLDIVLNDMRASDYKATYTTDKGTFEVNEPFIEYCA